METIPREDLTKRCGACKQIKPLSEFVPKTKSEMAQVKDKNDPLKAVKFRCKECYNKYHVEWRAKQGDKYREQSLRRYHQKLDNMTPDELEKFRADDAAKNRRRTAKYKDLVYNAYGGYKCACCGETEPMFLTIDHINNDGAQMRREVHGKTGTSMLRWLVVNNFPSGFQILCWNCQWGKVKNNGICPHQVTRNDYPEME